MLVIIYHWSYNSAIEYYLEVMDSNLKLTYVKKTYVKNTIYHLYFKEAKLF